MNAPSRASGGRIHVSTRCASCLCITDNEGIWTYNTKHFRQEIFKERIRVLSTKDVKELYPFKK